MSLYKDASLVMLPSAYKDGKLYSIRPTDGSGDFTFSRGSNLAATRVDVNGLIEKGRENLLLQSNQFDTTWSSINTTQTSGQSGYDGSNNAWLLSKSASSARVQQSISTSGVQTYSVYAKAGTLNYVMLNNSLVSQWFDLSNGTIGTNSSSANTIDAKIEDVGNGWYRCSLTFNSSISIVRIYPSQADNDVTGTSGSIYIQDAQLEQGLVATDYIETGATTAQAGILEDMPRLDYSGSCPSLLLEPQRSNLLEQAEYFGASYWSKANVDVELADTLSPDGFKNAYKITETSASGQHAINVFSSSRPNLSAGSHTHSCFVKVNGVEDIVFYNNGSSGGAGVNIDLSDGTYSNLTGGATAASVEPYSNNWYRVTLTFTAVVGNSSPSIYLRTTGSYTGDGVSGIYMYGMQTEAGSYPTSYIPTYGSSVTRSNDGGNLQLNDIKNNGFFGDTYTLFFEFDELDMGGTQGNFNYLYDTSNATCMYVYGNTLSINTTSGEQYTSFTNGFTNSSRGKFLVKYDGNEVKIFKDGSLYRTYTNPSSRWDNPKFYRLSLTTASASISYKQFLTFPTALTDSECIALTTL